MSRVKLLNFMVRMSAQRPDGTLRVLANTHPTAWARALTHLAPRTADFLTEWWETHTERLGPEYFRDLFNGPGMDADGLTAMLMARKEAFTQEAYLSVLANVLGSPPPSF